MHTRQVEVPTWGEVSSLHDSDRLFFNDGESRDEHGPPVRITSTTAPRPAADEYNDGYVADRDIVSSPEEEDGNEYGEIGQNSKHRENRAARLERFAAS